MKNNQKINDIVKISKAYKILFEIENLTINLAGLEPTIWKDGNYTIFDLILALYDNNFTVEITTNGSSLFDNADKYLESGLSKCRISIHSFDEKVYKNITGVNNLHKVLNGIKLCKEKGIKIHINRVLLRGYTDDIPLGLSFVQENNITLKLYDLWWTKRINEFYTKFYLHWKEIIDKYVEPISVEKEKLNLNLDRNRFVYKLMTGGKVIVKLFDSQSHNNHKICNFCPHKEKCKEPFGSYIHIFSNGNVTFCNLREDIGFNIFQLLKSNISVDELVDVFRINFINILGESWKEQIKGSKLRFYINEICNYNCSFPDHKKNYNSLWCLSSVKSNEIWNLF